jgi:aminopeptidase N
LYIEEKLGRLVSIDYLNKKRSYISNKLPMVGPRNVNYWGFDDVYWKGAWVLHTLRSVINDDDIFFKWIKESQKEFRHSIICSDEFLWFINEETEIDLPPIVRSCI